MSQIAEPKVKGVAFRTIEACYAELRGASSLTRARSMMQPHVREAYEEGLLLAASWYPISWYRDVFHAFRAATHEGTDLAKAIGYQASKRDMRSVYKMLFAKVVSPQTLLSMAGRVFNTYYDTGTFGTVESRRGFVLARASGCVGWDQNMWSEIVGSSTAMLEIAGAKEVRVRMLSGGKNGDETAELEAYWV